MPSWEGAIPSACTESVAWLNKAMVSVVIWREPARCSFQHVAFFQWSGSPVLIRPTRVRFPHAIRLRSSEWSIHAILGVVPSPLEMEPSWCDSSTPRATEAAPLTRSLSCPQRKTEVQATNLEQKERYFLGVPHASQCQVDQVGPQSRLAGCDTLATCGHAAGFVLHNEGSPSLAGTSQRAQGARRSHKPCVGGSTPLAATNARNTATCSPVRPGYSYRQDGFSRCKSVADGVLREYAAAGASPVISTEAHGWKP